MTMRPGVGRIIQLNKRIKELKTALEPLAVCSNQEGPEYADCGECAGCRARKVLEK